MAWCPVPAAGAAPAIPGPPYIDHTQWARWDGQSSLRVYPTPAGRRASGVASVPQGAEAWSEVLVDAPDAVPDSP